MGSTRWTAEEIEICKRNIPTQEVMDRTGRTMDAVRSKRYELTGHRTAMCERPQGICKPESLTEYEKAYRIYSLAKRLGVRLNK